MFSEDDLNKLKTHKEALQEALGFSVQLILREASDFYPEAGFRGGLILSIVGITQLILLQFLGFVWLPYPLLICFVLGAFLFFGGYILVGKSNGLKSYFSKESHLLRVDQEAARQWVLLTQEVDDSKPVLLVYVSLFEKALKVYVSPQVSQVIRLGVAEEYKKIAAQQPLFDSVIGFMENLVLKLKKDL